MSPRAIRRLVLTVFACGIVGMIVGSIADNNGTAISFGLLTAVAALGLILVTSVAGAGAFERPVHFDEQAAANLEASIEQLVAGGADEVAVRDLVRDAVRLGRAGR